MQFEIFTSSIPPTPRAGLELLVCITGTVCSKLDQVISPYRLKIEVTWVSGPDQFSLSGWTETIRTLRLGVSSAFNGDGRDGWKSFSIPALGLVGVRVTTG